MPAAERDASQGEPPAMRAARAMIDAGYRPVPITPGKKKPVGQDWGLIRHHPEKWRDPAVGIGVILGDDGTGRGLVDLEVDDPERARPTLDRIFPDGIPGTACFRANLGEHYLFRYDARLARYGQTIIKGEVDRKTGKVIGNPHYLGIELRVGTIDPAHPVQEQSIVPPTPRADGTPREWMDSEGEVLAPEQVFGSADRHILPLPECVLADLDRFADAAGDGGGDDEAEPTWDKEDVKAAILPHALALAKEWGLRVTGSRPTAKGFIECRSIDRKDAEPSCGFNPTTGVYTDRATGKDLSLFQLGLALKVAPDFPSLVNTLGRRFGVCPRDVNGKTVNKVNDKVIPASPDPTEWERPVERSGIGAPDFPLDVLPYSLAELCRQGAASMHCPPDYFAAIALGLAGGVIGRSVRLDVSSTWEVYANLYIAVVGPAGSKKSPAYKVMARPLWSIDRELRERFRREMAEFRKQRDEGGEPPVRCHLILDDTTREGFAKALADNPRGLVLGKDELTSWVAALNAYRQGKGDDKQFWMSLYSNAAVKVTRKGNQEDLFVYPSFGAVIGCLTPSTLPMMRESQRDDGWIDRLLFSYPDPSPRARKWNRSEISRDLLDDWSTAVRHLWARDMVVEEEGRHRPFVIHLDRQADALWEEWYNAHNAEPCEPGFPGFLEGPWSKLEGAALRIALILGLLRQAYDPEGGDRPGDLDALTIRDAGRLIDYFKAHFRRARAELARKRDGMTADARDVLAWIKGHDLREFTARDVIRRFPRFDELDRDEALSCLASHRYILRREPPPRPPGQKGKRPSPVYDVNPMLYKADSFDTLTDNPPTATSPPDSGKNGETVNHIEVPPRTLTWLVCFLTFKPQPVDRVAEAAAREGIDRAELDAAVAALGLERYAENGVEHWKLITF